MSLDLLLSWIQGLYRLVMENDEKALFLLLLIEEAGVPLPMPGDILIAMAGYRVSVDEMGLIEGLLAVTLAVQMGSTILYLLSRRLGHTLLFKYGNLIHLDRSKLEKAQRWILSRGAVMVFFGRLTPGLRTPTSIMAGVFEIPFLQFLLYTTLSAITWSLFWLVLGYVVGRRVFALVRYSHYALYVLVGALLVVGIGLMIYRWRRRARGCSSISEGVPFPGAPRSDP